ncbi:tetratricopeptide repeat protein [Flavobacteriaceae bacterium 144Ye]|nr:tetratricopeptide repeat protein [Flavobacteriaceae bacterium 144Ye]
MHNLLANTTYSKKALVIFLLLCINCIGILSISAQNNKNTDFKVLLENVLDTKPNSYTVLDSIFYRTKYDSINMKELVSKSKKLEYLEGESYGLNALGTIYRNVSLYDKAIETHLKSKEIAVEAKNQELEVINLNMLGVVYRRMDLVKPALDYHKKALDIANSFKNPTQEMKHSIAVSQNSMGNIYLALKQYDLAIAQFSKSLVFETEANNKLGLAINYQNIGYAKEAKGNLEDALKDYQTSLQYNNEIDSEIGRVICFNSIGKIYIKQGKYNDAKTILEDALAKALQVGDQFYIASSYTNLGWAQIELNLDTEAEDNLKKALKVGETYGLKSAVVEANEHLSDLYTKKGDYKTAMQHYKTSIELEETISNERNLQYVNDIIVQYENEIKNNQIRALASENEMVKSKLEKNKKIFWYTLVGLILVAGVIITLNRQRQLEQEKQILTLEQDMLRSQMNPHFIFNSLNSIKLYIINNEKENAVYYLNKFSKLIRKILIASTEKEISLEDELDTMRLYMNIENIRFSNEINFKIHIDDTINTASVKVPSMIFQPFLENALWHGLSTKKDNKKIDLHVTKSSNDYVTVTISDNGIGRKESEKINKSKLLKRKSVGIAITKARLSNFSKGYTSQYKLKIDDLYDNQQKPVGTKVIIDIPIQSQTLRTA